MAAADGGEEGRSFRVNFTADGVGKLRERVREKLREFMGDYTDDTLVEYVVVLLRNGRRKDEARNELNVFLGDDCVSFVSWLWDHLSSNLHLYAQAKEPSSDQVAKTKPTPVTLPGRQNLQLEQLNGIMEIDSEYDRPRSANVSRHQRNKELEGVVRVEAHPYSLRSIVSEDFHSEEKNNHRPNFVRQSRSPSPQIHRKRSREDEIQLPKRIATSHPVIDAPRRLLQFAVRDALRTVQQTSSRTLPSLKRLRSVVSTTTEDSVLEERLLIRSSPRVSEFVAMTPKAAAEANKDVRKVRYPGNVFDRLCPSIDNPETVNQPLDSGAHVQEGEYEYFDRVPESNRSNSYRNGNQLAGDASRMTILDRDNEMAYDSASDNDRYDGVSISDHKGLDASQSGSANKQRDKLITQYSATPGAGQFARRTGSMDHDPADNVPESVPRKIVNISVNVNTWKPPHYENSRSVKEEGNNISHKIDVGEGKPGIQLLKDVASTDFQKETQKNVASIPGSSITDRPDNEVDSRVLFVSNVHFAATKDTLSRHFNKFGEVLKVIIVTDATTGQPKGSAYVEFLQKESAEKALSVNGTSFMSRILKVVRRNTAQHESPPVTMRPSIARASPYSSKPRVPFPRGGPPGVFRGRLPTKPGARSLQWTRGTPNAQATEGLKNVQNAPVVPTPRGRNLTYIRPGLKAETVSGVASHT